MVMQSLGIGMMQVRLVIETSRAGHGGQKHYTKSCCDFLSFGRKIDVEIC